MRRCSVIEPAVSLKEIHKNQLLLLSLHENFPLIDCIVILSNKYWQFVISISTWLSAADRKIALEVYVALTIVWRFWNCGIIVLADVHVELIFIISRSLNQRISHKRSPLRKGGKGRIYSTATFHSRIRKSSHRRLLYELLNHVVFLWRTTLDARNA